MMKRLLSLILSLSLAAPSLALAEPPPAPGEQPNIREKLASKRAQFDFKKIARAPKQIKFYSNKLLTKIDQTPVAKSGKAWAQKATITYLTTLALLVSKEVFSRLQTENLELTEENVKKKVEEIESDWATPEKSVFVAADTLILFPITMGAEKLAVKAFPKLAAKQFAGEILSSFIVAMALSVGLTFINETILVASRYLIEHPEVADGNLSTDEIKALSLLNDRFRISYFTYGLIHGGPVTRSAYKKVLSSLSYIIFQEDELRSVLWSHAVRESALNGTTLSTFAFALTAGTLRARLIADGAKFATLKRTGFSIAAALTATILLPTWLQDKITYWSRRAWGLAYLHKIYPSEYGLKLARTNREGLASNYYPLVKIANDQIEVLVDEQKKIVAKLNDLNAHPISSPSLEVRLKKRLLENADNIQLYQNIIANTLVALNSTYKEDLNNLQIYISTNQGSPSLLITEAKALEALITFTDTVKDVLTSHFKATDPDFINSGDDYSSVRQMVDQYSFWGFSESALLATISNN